LSDNAKVTADFSGTFIYRKCLKTYSIFLSVTNSKNSFELTAFCGGAVSAQDVFLCEFVL